MQFRGFTLLEILIAMTITATVMSVLFGVYAACLDVARDIESLSRTDQMMRMVVSRISNDIRSYAPMTASDLTAFREEGNTTLESTGILESNATAATNETQGRERSVDLPVFIGNEVGMLLDQEDKTVVMSFPTRASLGFENDSRLERINLVSYVLVPEDAGNGSRTYRLLRRELPFAGLYPELAGQEMELADGLLWAEEDGPDYLDETGQMVPAWDGSGRKKEKKLAVPRLISWSLSVDMNGNPTSYEIIVRPLVNKAENS
jgi:prepilin-type N-terminal cleavage/methylation domain-containing protein